MKQLILFVLFVAVSALPSFGKEGCPKDGMVGVSATTSPLTGYSSFPKEESDSQRRYDYFFLEATRLKMQGEYDAAFEMLQHCLAIDPDAPSALYEVAQYYIYLKQVPQGIAALERAVQGDPDNYWYAQGLANLYMQQKQPDKAAALLEQMAVRFSDRLDPLYSLLDIYSRQEEYDKVLALLNQLEKRMGKNEQLAMEKFRIYVQKEDKKRAFREIENLVKEYPLDMRYRIILGDLYMQHDKPKKALEAYQYVLGEEPDNAQALYALAAYYDETGQTELYNQQIDTLLINRKVPTETKLNVMRRLIIKNEQAGGDSLRIIGLFDRVLEQETEEAELPMLYAQYLFSKKMQQEAMPVLQRVIAIEPENVTARMTLLGEAIRKQDYPEIIRLCEAGADATPEELDFHFYLAIAYNHEERSDDALRASERALKYVKADSNKEQVSDFYTIIGDTYHAKGENDKAFAAYDSALKYNPENIGTLNNYAYFLSVERRELDKAEEMSYKTVKAEPNNATYLDTYAWILFEKGNYAEARIYIDEAMKHKEGYESDVVVEHCGDIHAMTGDVEGALTHWRKALEMGSTSKTLKEKIKLKKYIPHETTATE